MLFLFTANKQNKQKLKKCQAFQRCKNFEIKKIMIHGAALQTYVNFNILRRGVLFTWHVGRNYCD